TVVAAARKSGISDDWIAAAQKSPVYRFVKEWELALPLHPEFRTLPMLFYIPPLLPVIASTKNGNYDLAEGEFFGNTENARIPMKYMANLFTAGNVEVPLNLFQDFYDVIKNNEETTPVSRPTFKTGYDEMKILAAMVNSQRSRQWARVKW
ncbi:hypothetical protein LCGC14_3078170, partial [marine sediment metagenome]